MKHRDKLILAAARERGACIFRRSGVVGVVWREGRVWRGKAVYEICDDHQGRPRVWWQHANTAASKRGQVIEELAAKCEPLPATHDREEFAGEAERIMNQMECYRLADEMDAMDWRTMS